LAENGFSIISESAENLGPIKNRYQVPSDLQSCHTATVGGYVIEGHVPVAEINRLLTERPANITGIAVPGMPIGSPGMEVDGVDAQPYDVIAWTKSGDREVYASYPR
jgi:hypothetical protein